VLLLIAIGIWLYIRRADLSREELIAYGKSLPQPGSSRHFSFCR
jgi:hypothetical protein